MNYLKNSLMLAAFMMPLSMLTAPLPKPADKGDKAGDIPASNSESYQMPAYVQESDFDLTGTRLIEDDPRLFSSDPEDRFHAQIKDFPKDIKEQAVMLYALRIKRKFCFLGRLLMSGDMFARCIKIGAVVAR